MPKYDKEVFRKREKELRELKKAELAGTYAERKAFAMERGTRGVWTACPLCGMSKKGTRPFIEPSLESYILQVRYGGGKLKGTGKGKGSGKGSGTGIGFFLAEEESTKLRNLIKVNRIMYKDLKAKIRKLNDLIV